jgi:5-methylcytosine-specific restriction protein A
MHRDGGENDRCFSHRMKSDGQSWRADRLTTAERGYGGRWVKLRAAHLAANPLCRMCLNDSPRRLTPGTVVDHVVPHRGDPALLYDPANLQTLCAPHHNGAKQSEEKSGRVRGCGPDGMPIDPGHPWNRGGPQAGSGQ